LGGPGTREQFRGEGIARGREHTSEGTVASQVRAGWVGPGALDFGGLLREGSGAIEGQRLKWGGREVDTA